MVKIIPVVGIIILFILSALAPITFGGNIITINEKELLSTEINGRGRYSGYWFEQDKLTASDGKSGDNFGECVSIDGDYAIIGAWLDDESTGSAYIFKRNGTAWGEEAKLTASDGEKLEFFGCSVSIDEDYAIIGAVFDDDNGDESGSAYVFKKNQFPNPPTIDGRTSGKVGVEYKYNFSLSDPDDDSMYLRVDWGNGTPGPWHGPYDSDTTVRLNHTWNQKGNFTIRAQAKDIYGAESDWGTLEVTMPKNKPAIQNTKFPQLFERFMNSFPLLERLLNLI